ncbi:serine hydrolase [Bacterioplanoides sp.]|uniref:serine hydrolase n=1 Tax=Bacterioplanoides sp. TaxID=2066072 RepID=UPI003B001CB5
MKTSTQVLSALSMGALLYGCTTETVVNLFYGLNEQSGNVHIIRATPSQPLTTATDRFQFPERFSSQGKLEKTQHFLKAAGTTGMVVTHQGDIVHEDYLEGYDQTSLFASWSVAKSYLSALIGIAIREGDIASVTDRVVDYVPELTHSPFAQVTIEQALEMGSGVTFDETYSSLNSDAARLLDGLKEDLLQQVLSYQDVSYAPGEFNAYSSLDSQVLGLVLNRATQMTTAAYAEKYLWQPAGMESNAQWLADQNHQDGTFCCLNTTTRDLNRFGLIYLNNGYYNGQQIIPQAWVEQSLNTDKPYLQSGENELSRNTWGYGYHWWVPGFDNDYAAVGVFNQYIYVMPDEQVVIAKHSAPGSYFINNRGTAHIDLFREIGKTLNRQYMNIINQQDGACMTVDHGLLTSHSNVKHQQCDGSLSQLWHYDVTTQQLINRDGGCLDAGDTPQEGDKLRVTACTESPGQQFMLSGSTIQPAADPDLKVDAYQQWIHGKAVGLWTNHGQSNQQWTFVPR